MGWRSIFSEFCVLAFLVVMAGAVVYVDRNMPPPPQTPPPAPKAVLVSHVPKHEPKLVVVATGSQTTTQGGSR